MRLVSHRCARYKTMPMMIASTSATMTSGSPVAWPLAALSTSFALVEHGLGGGQQHQVRLLGGHLEERAAGHRVAERVLGPAPRPRSRCRRAGRGQGGEGGGRGRVLAAGRAQAGQFGLGRRRGRPGSAGSASAAAGGWPGTSSSMVTSASATFWYSCWASRLSGSSTVTMALAADECSSATQPPNAPQASESTTSAISRASSVAGVRGGARPGRWPAGLRPVQGGGHGPISAIWARPSCATVGEQRLESDRVEERRVVPGGDHPAQEGPDRRRDAASGWLVLTTAYS